MRAKRLVLFASVALIGGCAPVLGIDDVSGWPLGDASEADGASADADGSQESGASQETGGTQEAGASPEGDASRDVLVSSETSSDAGAPSDDVSLDAGPAADADASTQGSPDAPKGNDARDEGSKQDASDALAREDAQVADADAAIADAKDEKQPGDAEAGAVSQILPPRPIAPLSTSTVTSQRPTLRWSLAAGTDGAFVQICRDRACASPVTTLELDGAKGAPAANLTKGTYFWRAFGRRGGVKGAVASATWQFSVGARSTPVDTSWGSTLDVNGDGFADVVVSDPDGDNIGYVYLYYGSAGGLLTTPSVTLVNPKRVFNSFGFTVASAGDVNGDGYADVVVSTVAGSTGDTDGEAYVYLGGPGGLLTTPITLRPPVAGATFGGSLVSAGDVNGDGYADIGSASSATLDPNDPINSTTEWLHLFWGGPSGPSSTSVTTIAGAKGESLGGPAAASDVNGDGYTDLVALAMWWLPATSERTTNRVYVYLGAASGISQTRRLTLLAPNPGSSLQNSQFGRGFDGNADVNGDGFADIVVGAPLLSLEHDAGTFSSGQVYVYLGRASGMATTPATTIDGKDDGEWLGIALANAGDLNGDGYSDIVVGAPEKYRAYVYYGSSSGLVTVPAAKLDGPVVQYDCCSFGSVVAGVGDTDGDGTPDFVVGAPYALMGTGRAYLYLGGALGAVPTTILAPLYGHFGSSIASVRTERERVRQTHGG